MHAPEPTPTTYPSPTFTPDPPAAAARFARARRRRRTALIVLLALIILSNITMLVRPARAPHRHDPRAQFITIPTINTLADRPHLDTQPTGEHAAPPTTLAYLHWPPTLAVGTVLLVHGGPGRASDLDQLGPALAARGYHVYAPDLLGYGDSTRDLPDYSILANALACHRLLDHLKIDRAHIVGWSQGGGVVLHMAEPALDTERRIASVTLLAAIAAQETEGSGLYTFEHARYRLGQIIQWSIRHLLPHFGLLPQAQPALLRFFADSDQRPLGPLLSTLQTPVLVLHGRHDFLVPPWAAELHAAMARDSRLVMTPHSHFMAVLQPDLAAQHLDDFFRAAPAIGPPGTTLDDAPVGEPWGTAARRIFTFNKQHVWLTVALIALATYLRPRSTAAALCVLLSALTLDYGIAIVAMLIAEALLAMLWLVRPVAHSHLARWPQRESTLRAGLRQGLTPPHAPSSSAPGHLAGWLIARCIIVVSSVTVGSVTAAIVSAAPRYAPGWSGGIAIGGAFIAAYTVIFVIDHAFTWAGRRLFLGRVSRWRRYEFWSPWVFYLPLFPLWVSEAIRAGHPVAFTACNPTYGAGGGLIGESKASIMSRLHPDPLLDERSPVCPTFLIDSAPAADRLARFQALRLQHADMLAYPVILKPDQGGRGFAVKLIRSDDDARRYLLDMTRPAVLQPFHPGPFEVGIMWIRDRGIFSITTKAMPLVEGDGLHTLEEVILRHPRYRLQASTYFKRHALTLSRVPEAGEAIPLGIAGNHCQGALFRDGADLITPALTRTINELAHRFGTQEIADSGELDFGRFDIRCRSLDDLRAGRLDPRSIVELNGSTSESTNIYDPGKNIWWAYGYLFAQWRSVYRLGGARMRAGHRPLTVRETLASLWRNYAGRPGSAVSD